MVAEGTNHVAHEATYEVLNDLFPPSPSTHACPLPSPLPALDPHLYHPPRTSLRPRATHRTVTGAIAVARGVLGHVFASTWVALELLHSPFLLLREILFKRLFVIETLGLLSLIVGALLTTWLLTPIFIIRIPIHKLDREFDHARSFETAPNRRFIGSWFRRHPWAIPSWVSEPDFERVAWVGDALSLYWPALRQSLRRKIYTVMDKVLHEKLLKKLKLQHLVPRGFTWNIDVDIGSVPLRLGGIKTHGQGRMNQSIIVEAQVMWGSEKLNVKTALQYVTDSGIKFYFPILAISDLILSGPVRVRKIVVVELEVEREREREREGLIISSNMLDDNYIHSLTALMQP